MLSLLLAAGVWGRLYLEFIYIALFLIGLVGLGFSLMFGDHGDHDADADHEMDHGIEHDAGADHDHDGDHEAHGPGNMSFLSLKVLWCLFVGGGAGGYIGAFNNLGGLGSFACASLAGLIVASIGYAVMNSFYRGQSSSTVRTASLVGATGSVDTNISATGTGRIQLSTPTGSVLMMAESTNHEELPEGTRVKVTDVIGSTCFVVRA